MSFALKQLRVERERDPLRTGSIIIEFPPQDILCGTGSEEDSELPSGRGLQ
jgi:hypothetical protein